MNEKQVELADKTEKRDRKVLKKVIENCFKNWENLKQDFEAIISARTDQLSAEMICSIADSDESDKEVWRLIDEYVQTYRIKNE